MAFRPEQPVAHDSPTTLAFEILGPLGVFVGGDEVVIATRRQRALLMLLLLNVGRVVSSDRLIDQLWDGSPPPQGGVTLRSYVSNLRQALGGRSGAGGALVTRGPGYLMEVDEDAVDSVRLRKLTESGRSHLRLDRPADALADFERAVALWRGDPLSEIADHEVAQSAITQLTETYLGAMEGRFEALLGTARHLDALAELEAFTQTHPLREAPRALLMKALYRAGRAPEALEVHRRFRHLLRDELGIDPSPQLDQLNQQVLEQSPLLDLPTSPAAISAPSSRSGRHETRRPPAATAEAAAAGLRDRVMVGRARESQAMRGHLRRLTEKGTGALVLVGGEPGIGKTTLLEAFERDAFNHGVRVHSGRPPAATGAPPFWPWVQVLDSVAAALDDEQLAAACTGAARPISQLSTTIAERMGHPPVMIGDSAQALRFVLYEAVSTFLLQASPQAPTLILLDDMHWADLPSLEILSYLTPSLATRPLVVVAAYRDLPAERSAELDATLATVSREDIVDEFSLGGLESQYVAELAHDLVNKSGPDAAADESFVSMLRERTGGNPFFIRQLTRFLLEEASSGEQSNPATVPPGVRHVIGSRLRNLGSVTAGLLEAAAVVGREFDLRIVAVVARRSVEEALDACDEAARYGLVEPGSTNAGGFRFVHALVQEVVLDSLPAGRAVRLHAAAAEELLREGAGVEEVAEHWWLARALVGERAVPVHLQAAEKAIAVYAYESAEQYLRRALDLLRRGVSADPHAELSVLLSLLRLIATDRGWGAEDARDIVDRARELTASSPVDSSMVRPWWFMWQFALDHDDVSSLSEVVTGLKEAARASDDNAAQAAAALMSLFDRLASDDQGGAVEELHAARSAVERATNEQLAAYDEHLHVTVLATEGHVAALAGDASSSRASFEAAVALADADGRPFPRAVSRTLAAIGAAFVADPREVAARARAALELNNRFGFNWLAAVAECVETWAASYLENAR